MNRTLVLVSLCAFAAPALAQEEPLSDLPSRAAILESRTDFPEAAALLEQYSDRCLASATAVLDRDQPCAEATDALAHAFELRRALGDVAGANGDAQSFLTHYLYADPRTALEIAYRLALFHVDGGRLDEAERALLGFAALHPDPPPGQAIVVEAALARIAVQRRQASRAARHWTRVERLWSHQQRDLQPGGAVPLEWVRTAVAEARLARAELRFERFRAIRPPPARAAENDEQWVRSMTPWMVRVQRRLILARMEYEQVWEMGAPEQSVIAAARIGEMYAELGDLYDDIPAFTWPGILIRHGEGRPGYEVAREHLETCIEWAGHHGVARQWADRCEQRLHDLDPARYPLPAELTGHASYHPALFVDPSTVP